MKKYYCILLILILLCTNSCNIRKMTSDDIFRKWQLFAVWYLINPFGYHNYMPLLKALQAKNF